MALQAASVLVFLDLFVLTATVNILTNLKRF